MNPTHDGHGAPLDRLDEEADWLLGASLEAERVLSDAHAAYAPAPQPPVAAPGGAGPPRVFGPDSEPDRLITRPLWFLWVLLVHLAAAPVLLGVIAAGTAVLALVFWLLVDSRIGFPLLSPCAGCVGVLAAGGTVVHIVRSFREMLRSPPWD